MWIMDDAEAGLTRISDFDKDQPVQRKGEAMRQREEVKLEDASGVETTKCQCCRRQSGIVRECDCGVQCCDHCEAEGHGYTCHTCDGWICPACVYVDDEGTVCEECLYDTDE